MRKFGDNRGFTLLEVLVAVAIMGLIMVMVWSNTSQTLNSKDRIEKRDQVYQNARVALQKITDDISMSFLTKDITAVTPVPGLTPTVVTIPRPITFFIGRDEGTRDAVSFTSFSHMRYFTGAKESDQCKIAYEVMPSPDEPNVLNLVRREVPWLDSTTDITSTPIAVAENIKEFELEYYDTRKDEWVRAWDSQSIDFKDQLPRAVKITLVFPDPDDEDLSIVLSTIVLLPMSQGPVEI